MRDNIKTQAELIALAEQLRAQGKKVVAYNGSFDVLHAGHAESLERAKACGDVLMVFVNSDVSVKRYKGPLRPLVPEAERAELVAALRCVDYVTLFDELTPKKLLGELQPDIYCSGPSWGKDCIERPVIEAYGGQVVELPMRGNLSTSHLLKKIAETHNKPVARAVFLDRDGVINDNGDGYTHKKEDFVFLPRVIEALQRLAQTDYKIVIFTIQSGVARGFYTEADVHTLHEWMCAELARHGARIDKIYYCPHHPDFTGDCACRKPKPGMLLQAADELGLSLNDSWVIGDSDRDVLTGREVNARTIKVAGLMDPASKVGAHHEVADLWEAVEIIAPSVGATGSFAETAQDDNAVASARPSFRAKYTSLVRRMIGAAVRKRREKQWINAVKTLFFLITLPIEFIGDALFVLRRLAPLSPPAAARKILIAKPDQMGDVLFTTFLLPQIAAAYPDAEIHYLVTERTRPILENNPRIAKLHLMDYFSIGIVLGRGKHSFAETVRSNVRLGWQTLRALRNEQYDIIINARAYPPSNNWFLRLARPRHLISFDISLLSFLANTWARYDLLGSEEENVARLVEALPMPASARAQRAVEFHNFADSDATREKLLALGGPDLTQERYAVVSPVTFDVERCVSIETWARLIRYLIEEKQLRIVISALPSHASYAEEIKQRAGYADIVITTAFSLPELATIMRHAKLLLTIDSLPAFLGVAAGTPTVEFVNEDVWFVKGLSKEQTFVEARSIVPVGASLKAVYPLNVDPATVIATLHTIV